MTVLSLQLPCDATSAEHDGCFVGTEQEASRARVDTSPPHHLLAVDSSHYRTHLVNSVRTVELPHLGEVELVTRKARSTPGRASSGGRVGAEDQTENSRTSRFCMNFGPSSGWPTRSRRCWRAHPFDRAAWPAVHSGSISLPAGPSNGRRVSAWCTTLTSPRSRKGHGHSYSVPLRPDIALSIPDGPNSGLHLFDAKFRVQGLADVGLSGSDKGGDDDKAGERAGTFKRGPARR